MTPIERMQEIETTLQALFRHIQWTGDSEAIRLVDEALSHLAELLEQRKILAEIF